MADKSVDAIFAEILKDSRAIAIEVVESSAKKAQTDIMLSAYSYLKKYYNNYTPKQYKRTHQLHKAIVPVLEGKTKKGSEDITIRVGVEYDSTFLEGLYHSNSRWHQSGDTWVSNYDAGFNWDKDGDGDPIGNNGIPEAGWILENYLSGVHPWGQNDGLSTNKLMKKFIEKDMETNINKYVQSALMDALNKRL